MFALGCEHGGSAGGEGSGWEPRGAGGVEHDGGGRVADDPGYHPRAYYKEVLLHGVLQPAVAPTQLGDVAADGRACDEAPGGGVEWFEKENVLNAFIFCLYTGMRFCDVKDLHYSNIDYGNKLSRFEQDKTIGHSARSWVTIPLNDGLIHLVGRTKEGETKESLVFNLPSYESCCKSVKRWVKRAGIDKHISWHCARHSFAVNILNNGTNIKTVDSLLGHSGLKHTEKNSRAVDKLNEDAINSQLALNL